MKYMLIPLFVCLFSHQLLAQQTDTLYYDVYWHLAETTEAAFYRVTHVNREDFSFEGTVKDYFYENDHLIMEGNYEQGKKEGIFTFYHINGQIESTGLYKDNKRTGEWKYYYRNGKPNKLIDFTSWEENGWYLILSHWNAEGLPMVTEGNGTLRDIERNAENNRLMVQEGQVQNGKKYGTWTLDYLDGEKLLEEIYREGMFSYGNVWKDKISSPYFDESRLNLTEPAEIVKPEFYVYDYTKYDRSYYGQGFDFFKSLFLNNGAEQITFTAPPYTQVAVSCKGKKAYTPAQFPGGPLALYTYFQKNKTPDTVPGYRKGKIIINFSVNRYGRVKDYFISKGLSIEQNKKAIEALKSTQWMPASCSNSPVISHLKVAVAY